MAQEKLSVRKIREVIRLKLGCGLPNRAVARSCRVSPSTVSDYVNRAKAAELGWPLPEEMDDKALFALLFPVPQRESGTSVPLPEWAKVRAELSRKGVTLQLLWREYRAEHPNGYGYSQFCELYGRWKKTLNPTMRQSHEAGEGYVDYAGLTMSVVDPSTGEVREAQIFVYTLAASNYIYAEAQWTQELANWIGGHIRAFEHFGGVVPLTVPDNLKSGVHKACRYEPDLNPTYLAFAVHCQAAVVPARVRTPRDKAKVETGVQIVERDVLAPLRDQTFIGLAAANDAIRQRLAIVNERTMRHLGQSRRELMDLVDRPALLPLPDRPFEMADWKPAKVAIDYHVEFDHHFYSVPYQLIGKQVEIRAAALTIEVFEGGVRLASHVRSQRRGGHTTDPAHMPESHRAHAQWTPERFIAWAARIGPQTQAVITELLERRVHPQQAFRSCLGVLRLGDRYTPERLEAACRRALVFGLAGYKGVKNILDTGLDAAPLPQPELEPTAAHANVRGPDYYT
ncbi:MAG: IS21 family transposase [Fimbriimonadaceae bacterium]|nr:IS21 family transposase [Fimbriimonadaceae bacterium]